MPDGSRPLCHPARQLKARGMCPNCYRRTRREESAAVLATSRVADRRRKQRFRYGLEPGDYEALLVSQGGGCRVCARTPEDVGRLHVDHDHGTGSVRALLCADCNRAIGMFGEAPDRLRAAALYLEAFA